MSDETLPPAAAETLPEAPVPQPPIGYPVVEELPQDTTSYDALPVEPAPTKPTVEKVTEAAAPERPVDRPADYVGFNLPRGANPNIANYTPVFRPAPNDRVANDPFHVASLPCDVEAFNSLVNSYPSINYELGEGNREWAAEITLGSSLLHQGGFLTKATDRPDAKWSQRVPHGASALGATRPRLGQDAQPGQEISGELAANRVQQALGMGAPTAVPLWHSGFWVTFKSPTAMARLELQRRIDSEKIWLGRMTNGMAYSNASVYLKSYLADFAMAHVSTATVRYAQAQDLKDLIKSTDIPTLIWGMLTTLYPQGYPYHQPCMNDPSQCTHVVKEVLDINKIHFTDLNRLTEAQLKHMARRGERMDIKDIEAYQKDHSYNGSGLIELKNDTGVVKVQLKVPTITEYASAGFHWVDGLVADIQRAFGSELVGEQRNNFILERAKVTSMCEYSHWIEELGLPDGSVIRDLDTIRQTLVYIGGEPTLAETFFTQVQSFMENCTIAMVALPRFDCPACGKPATPEEAKHPYLNPIDVEALFFMMLGQLVAKALT